MGLSRREREFGQRGGRRAPLREDGRARRAEKREGAKESGGDSLTACAHVYAYIYSKCVSMYVPLDAPMHRDIYREGARGRESKKARAAGEPEEEREDDSRSLALCRINIILV